MTLTSLLFSRSHSRYSLPLRKLFLLVFLSGFSASVFAVDRHFTHEADAMSACLVKKDELREADPYDRVYGNCAKSSLPNTTPPSWALSVSSVYEQWRFIFTVETPVCEDPNYIDPDTGACVTPAEPSQCYEQNLAYDSTSKPCTEVCENGELDGVCLNPVPDNEETCNESREDYKGYLGNGNNRVNFCANDMQCEGGDFGLVGDQMACIPNEYGSPECSGSQVLTKTRYGFHCKSLQPESNEEEPEPPRDPNDDTDGDGVPDAYNPDLDPSSVDKQLDQTNKKLDAVGEGIGKTNSKLDLIYGAADELVSQGDRVEEGMEEAVGMLESNTSDTGSLGDDGLDLTENENIQVPDILGNYTNVDDPVISECPAPRELVLGIGTFQVVWTPWCDFASQIRPFVIFMFTFIGVMAVGRTVIA